MDGRTLLRSNCWRLIGKFAILKESGVPNILILSFGSYSEETDVADRGKSFTSEPKTGNLAQITELNDLAGRESFTEDWEIL